MLHHRQNQIDEEEESSNFIENERTDIDEYEYDDTVEEVTEKGPRISKRLQFRAFVTFICLVAIRIGQLILQGVAFNSMNMAPWKQGFLDIHHMRVGASETTFIIFPDGTTLLIDSGDVNIRSQLDLWEKEKYDLEMRPRFPNESKSASGWVIDYMKEFWPREENDFWENGLDYVLITHFHSDHVGEPSEKSVSSKSGNFVLSGITEIGDQVPIRILMDRGYPDYDAPSGFLRESSSMMNNYLNFTKEYVTKGLKVERFKVGSISQIVLQHNEKSINTHFRVRNIKGNLDVAQPDGTVKHIQDRLIEKETSWDENELSNAIVVEYGTFRYYEGGDQESHKQNGKLFDTITPTARAAGPVDVATLNHHGHGLNSAFVNIMDPKIAILQVWCSVSCSCISC